MPCLILLLAASIPLASISWSEDDSSPVGSAGHSAASNKQFGSAPQTQPPGYGGDSAGYGGGSPGAASGPGYSTVREVKTTLAEPEKDVSGVWRGTRELPSREPEPSAQNAPSEPMSLSTARSNFPVLVETMVLTRSPSGYWSYPLRGSSPPRKLKLRLHKTEKGSLELLTGTLYQGFALFRDLDSRRLFRMDFTVDYGMNAWAITDHKLNIEGVDDGPATPARKPAMRKNQKTRAGSKSS